MRPSAPAASSIGFPIACSSHSGAVISGRAADFKRVTNGSPPIKATPRSTSIRRTHLYAHP